MSIRFANKSILVSGAGSGIGRAASLAFAAEGGRLVLVDRNSEANTETLQIITEAGGQAVAISADVTSSIDCERMVATAVEAFGQLDIAFNNAGVAEIGLELHETGDDQWAHVLAVNLTGVFNAMKHEIVAMRKSGGGVIVNTASVAGLIGTPGAAAYTATKHGVLGLTKAAALENIGHNIRINALCPGATRTAMLDEAFAMPGMEEAMMSSQPIGRIAEPEEMAKLVLLLASDDSSFMVGSALVADGGLSTA